MYHQKRWSRVQRSAGTSHLHSKIALYLEIWNRCYLVHVTWQSPNTESERSKVQTIPLQEDKEVNSFLTFRTMTKTNVTQSLFHSSMHKLLNPHTPIYSCIYLTNLRTKHTRTKTTTPFTNKQKKKKQWQLQPQSIKCSFSISLSFQPHYPYSAR